MILTREKHAEHGHDRPRLVDLEVVDRAIDRHVAEAWPHGVVALASVRVGRERLRPQPDVDRAPRGPKASVGAGLAEASVALVEMPIDQTKVADGAAR